MSRTIVNYRNSLSTQHCVSNLDHPNRAVIQKDIVQSVSPWIIITYYESNLQRCIRNYKQIVLVKILNQLNQLILQKKHVFRNIIFKYFKDTDNLSVYLVDCNSSVEDHCIDVTVNFLISYDINEKIVAFHVGGVSQLLSCNTFDLDEAFNEDPPKPVYFEDSDILIVSLVNSTLGRSNK
uniref:Uncharacterized protein n=1 Tax=Rhizophagus irregularis (strain DAOM 181602 / DAOM 197198 / MUCL 43194) TaxID=747089 RepID=U9SUA3_RHIID